MFELFLVFRKATCLYAAFASKIPTSSSITFLTLYKVLLCMPKNIYCAWVPVLLVEAVLLDEKGLDYDGRKISLLGVRCVESPGTEPGQMLALNLSCCLCHPI